MKIFKLGLLAALSASLMGCSVMHFKNGSIDGDEQPREKWHHNFAYSLYEGSPPIDLKSECEGRAWSNVTTKETLVTGLAGGADDAVTAGILKGGGINLWDPQLVVIECGDGSPSSQPDATSTPAAVPLGN